jgi:hypothetical protein
MIYIRHHPKERLTIDMEVNNFCFLIEGLLKKKINHIREGTAAKCYKFCHQETLKQFHDV